MENSVTDLARLEDFFKSYEDTTWEARQHSERARDYYDGKQLTDTEIETLKRRGQPPVVFNRIRRKIEWLKGLEVKQRTDPKAFPRTPQHTEGAESVTDALRFVCDNADWDMHRSNVYDNMLVEGFGGCEIVHEENARGQIEVVVNHYPWDRLFYDPHSRKPDFSDARFRGVVMWMDEADFLEQHKGAKSHLEALCSSESGTETFDDRPQKFWVDPARKRVRVFLMWYRDSGGWKWCKFVKGHKLEGGESPYVDEDGRSVCPLIMQSAFVDRDNNRYGIVRDMIDPQDEINKRRSRALFGITARQTISVKGALENPEHMKAELSKLDGNVEIALEAFEEAARVGMKPFEIVNTNDRVSGDMAMLEDAKNEIDLLGANSALAGETGESASGRAVLARQQGGMIDHKRMSVKARAGSCPQRPNPHCTTRPSWTWWTSLSSSV